MMNQRVIGVIENMAYLDTTCPHCDRTHRVDLFGTGGGTEVARTLTARLGYQVPLLAEVPLDPALRAGGDEGVPLVSSAPDNPAAVALAGVARDLAKRGRGLLGRQLGLAPVAH
jgi:ATP-binding protein involved in chromosome partitioning